MQLTKWDFERLLTNGTSWGESWSDQVEDRFEQLTPDTTYDDPISLDWEHAYWIADVASDLILARHYLEGLGEPYAILWDLANQRAGWSQDQYEKAGITTHNIGSYVILTNYLLDTVIDSE